MQFLFSNDNLNYSCLIGMYKLRNQDKRSFFIIFIKPKVLAELNGNNYFSDYRSSLLKTQC